MQDNLIGSIDYSANVPVAPIKETQQALPYVSHGTDVKSLSELFSAKEADTKPMSDADFISANRNKYLKRDAEVNPYFIKRQEYDRYLKDAGTFWKKGVVFKDPRYFDNEEINDKNQGEWSSLGHGITKTLPNLVSSFVNGFRYDQLFNPKATEFDSWMDKWQKDLENEIPNFYSKSQSDSVLKGIVPFTEGSGNFWGDKVFKNAGFTIGAIGSALVQSAAIDFATGGLGVSTNALIIGKAVNNIEKVFLGANEILGGVKGAELTGQTFMKAKSVLEQFKNLSAGQKALTYTKLGFLNLMGSHGEALAESMQGSFQINQALIDDFSAKNGRLPSSEEYAEIRKVSDAAANVRYGLNLPLLLVTNAIQFGDFFSPSKILQTGGFGYAAKEGIDATGNIITRGFKDFTKLEKATHVLGSEFIKDFVSEGSQEGLQYSFEKATEDFAFKKYNSRIKGSLTDYLDSQLIGLNKMFTDNEGLQSILIGGLTGALTTGAKGLYERLDPKSKAAKAAEDKQHQALIDTFNNTSAKDIMNSDTFKSFFGDLLQRDGVALDASTISTVISLQMQKALETGNISEYKGLQHDKLFNLVDSAVKLGKTEALAAKIGQMKDLGVDEKLEVLGITESLTDAQKEEVVQGFDRYVDGIIEKSQKMKSIIETVGKSMLNPYNPGDTTDPSENFKYNAFNDLKQTFAHQLSFVEDLDARLGDDVQALLKVKGNPLSEEMIGDLIAAQQNKKDSQSRILDDLTSGLITDEGNVNTKGLNDKYIQAYNQQSKDLHTQYENLNHSIIAMKAMGLDVSDVEAERDEVARKKNKHDAFMKVLGEKTRQWHTVYSANQSVSNDKTIAAFKDVMAVVLQHEMNKDLKKSLSLVNTDEVINALADLHRLNDSIDTVLHKNGELRTEIGKREFIDTYVKTQELARAYYLKRIKQANYDILKAHKEEALKELYAERDSNIVLLKDLIDEANKLTIENDELNAKADITDEDKVKIEANIKKIEELKSKIDAIEARQDEVKQLISDLEQDLPSPTPVSTEEKTEENVTTEQPKEDVEIIPSADELPEVNEEIGRLQEIREHNAKVISEKIEILKRNKALLSNDAQAIRDTLEYLNSLLDNTSQLVGKDVDIIINEINKLLSMIRSNSAKNTARGGRVSVKIQDLQQGIKNEFIVLNSIQDRIRSLRDNLTQLETIEKDLQNQVNYYNNLIADENFKTLTKEELENKVEEIKKKQSVLQKLVDAVRRAIKQSVDYLKGYIDLAVGNIKALDEFSKENNFKVLDRERIKELIAKEDPSLNDYTELKSQFDKLEAVANKSIDDVTLLEEIKALEEKRLDDLHKKIEKYDDQMRYISELLNDTITESKATVMKPSSKTVKPEETTPGTTPPLPTNVTELRRNTEEQIVTETKEVKKNTSRTTATAVPVATETSKPDKVKKSTTKVETTNDVDTDELLDIVIKELTLTDVEQYKDERGRVPQMAQLKTTPNDFRDEDWGKPEGKGITKIADKKFQAFINFLEDMAKFTGVSPEEWLMSNKLGFAVMTAPDDVFGSEQIFDESYRNKPRGVVSVIVKLDENGQVTPELANFRFEEGKFILSAEGDIMAQPIPIMDEKEIVKFPYNKQAQLRADRLKKLGALTQKEIDAMSGDAKKAAQKNRDRIVAQQEAIMREDAKSLLKIRKDIVADPDKVVGITIERYSEGSTPYYTVNKEKTKLTVDELFKDGKLSANVEVDVKITEDTGNGKIAEYQGIPYLKVFSTDESYPGYEHDLTRQLIAFPMIASSIDNNRETLNILHHIFNNFAKLTNEHEQKNSPYDINEIASFLTGSILFNTEKGGLKLKDGSSLVIRTSFGYADDASVKSKADNPFISITRYKDSKPIHSIKIDVGKTESSITVDGVEAKEVTKKQIAETLAGFRQNIDNNVSKKLESGMPFFSLKDGELVSESLSSDKYLEKWIGLAQPTLPVKFVKDGKKLLFDKPVSQLNRYLEYSATSDQVEKLNEESIYDHVDEQGRTYTDTINEIITDINKEREQAYNDIESRYSDDDGTSYHVKGSLEGWHNTLQEAKDEIDLKYNDEIARLTGGRTSADIDALDKYMESIPDIRLNFIEDPKILSKKATEKVYITNAGQKLVNVDATVADQQRAIQKELEELEKIINCIW